MHAVYIRPKCARDIREGKNVKSSNASREFGYLRKWIPIALLIGTISGFGAILFYEAIRFTSTLLSKTGPLVWKPLNVPFSW
jgi:hypothetical protein